jgi:general secretion pathway protein K
METKRAPLVSLGRRSRPQQQGGVALLATLILVLALTLIIGNIFYRHQIDVSQATGSLHGDQAVLLAISAESWARDLLASDNDDLTVDHFGEDWAQAIPLLPVDGGTIVGCLVDLESRVNINNFSTYTESSLSAERKANANNMGLVKLWESLLQNMDVMVNENRVTVIIDWLDKGDELIGPAGAEQSDYSGFNPPRFPANTEIADTAELAAMTGYSLAEVQRLMPFISALPGPTTININSAPEAVLMALSGDLGIDFVDMVLDNRPFLTLQEFYQAIDIRLMVGEPALAIRWPAKLIDVKSDFFQLNLEVTLGQSRLEVKSIMQRGANRRPVVIRREITVVPAGVTTVPSRPRYSDDENAEEYAGSRRDRFDDQEEYDREYYLRPICEITNSYTTGDLGSNINTNANSNN